MYIHDNQENQFRAHYQKTPTAKICRRMCFRTAILISLPTAGYPNGVNRYFYATIAITEIDFLGLLTILIGGAGENSSHHGLKMGAI